MAEERSLYFIKAMYEGLRDAMREIMKNPQVTDVFVLPVTVAVNCCVPPTVTVGFAGVRRDVRARTGFPG